jgi:hypothetical protein
MKRLCIFLAAFIGGCVSTTAQKGNNNIQLVAETGLPLRVDQPGFGGFIKGLYGTGKNGQLTFTAGVSKFYSKKMADAPDATTRLVSVLLGYKHHVSRFYIEPQAGLGELGGKYNLIGDYSRPSVAAFYWGAGAGIQLRRFDIGLRYVHVKGIEGTDAGVWHDRKFEYAGLHIGYNLFR